MVLVIDFKLLVPFVKRNLINVHLQVFVVKLLYKIYKGSNELIIGIILFKKVIEAV